MIPINNKSGSARTTSGGRRAATSPPPQSLDANTVAELRAIVNRVGDVDGARKRELLRQATRLALTDADTLIAYHDILLFALAYPENGAMRRDAANELARVADVVRTVDAAGPKRVRARLRGSGIAWSTITIAFGNSLARWLVSRYPGCAEIDSLGERAQPLAEWMKQALPPLEFELAASGEDAPEALIEAGVAGWRRSRLAWLLAQLERLPCSAEMRATLFDGLQLFIALNPRDQPISRTFARGLPIAPYYHRVPLLRRVDAASLVSKPLPAAQRLSRDERMRLIDTARGVLAMLGRETDPISHADFRYVQCHALGRGLAIALYSAEPALRNPLDSHIGYVLFKNAVPVAYGGGWPFLGTCKIGINIFAPFRGGESAVAMASVLRVYAQRFVVERFLVEPYQFGAGNREGLESGAFWFYYRLGFRPVDARTRDLAFREFERMRRGSGYRTPLPVLRRLARFDLELAVVPAAQPACDPADLSRATTAWIARLFHGNRDRAEAFAVRYVSGSLGLSKTSQWSDAERNALRAMAPAFAQVDDLRTWPVRDKTRVAALIRAKGGDEYRYFALMARFPRLRRSLDAVAARGGA